MNVKTLQEEIKSLRATPSTNPNQTPKKKNELHTPKKRPMSVESKLKRKDETEEKKEFVNKKLEKIEENAKKKEEIKKEGHAERGKRMISCDQKKRVEVPAIAKKIEANQPCAKKV
jgi:hypothetical protein